MHGSTLEPKNILITGAAQGLGRALSRYLALRGHCLFLVDINEEELKYTATVHLPKALANAGVSKGSKINGSSSGNGTEVNGLTNGDLTKGNHGNEVHFKAVDLRNPLAVREAVDLAVGVFGGRIDVLINNAGISRAQWSGGRSMDDVSVNNEWLAYIETNLTAPFLLSQACIPFMKIEDKEMKSDEFHLRPEAQASASGKSHEEITASVGRSPCIINISSFRALQSEPNCEAYAASKAGMLGLTHAMAMSGARWGIRVNAILPGFIYVLNECKSADESGLTWAQPIPESRHRQHPTGRVGWADDVSATVDWLMDAGFVTGQEIIVDGGVSKVKYAHA